MKQSVWQPMELAPRDGREIEILFRHMNYRYADEADRDKWQQVCRAYWTDFNGGGWVWHGIYGDPVGWKPLPDAPNSRLSRWKGERRV